jgi:hypothetical protein
MSSETTSSVSIQASSESVPSVPAWFGEVTLIARHLEQQGMLQAVNERVRFARRRFGQYEVIDFFAVVLGYAVSGEPTLEAFYKRLKPFESVFMALFGRDRCHVPHSVAFWQHLTREVLSRCAHCLWRICWFDPCRVRNRAGCGIGKEYTG